jgi:hypothetical protein
VRAAAKIAYIKHAYTWLLAPGVGYHYCVFVEEHALTASPLDLRNIAYKHSS